MGLICCVSRGLLLTLTLFAGDKEKACKGQTLREIEDAEGGPVKESMVGMAAVKRALKRKKTQGERRCCIAAVT